MILKLFKYIIKIEKKNTETIVDPYDGPIQRACRKFHEADNFDMYLMRDAYYERQNLIKKFNEKNNK